MSCASCDFLHVTLVQNDEIVNQLAETKFKCAGCGDHWTNMRCVLEHIIKNLKLYFCLNCDDWIVNKSKVLDEDWTLLDNMGNLRKDL